MGVEELKIEITEKMLEENYVEAKKILFKLNNMEGLNVLDRWFALYRMAYCLDELKELDGSKYYVEKVVSYMQPHKEDYPTHYCKCLSLKLYQDRFHKKEEELLEDYCELYKYSKMDEELELSTLSSIYKIKKDFQSLINVFKVCVDKNYIRVCHNILNINNDNEGLVIEMQDILNRKQMNVA